MTLAGSPWHDEAMRSVGFRGACAFIGLALIMAVAGGCSSGDDSASVASKPVSTVTSIVEAVSRFVIPESGSMSLIDVQVAGASDREVLAGRTFSPKESPDDDDDEEPRAGIVVFDPSARRFDDLRAGATEIDVAGRTFSSSSDGENQRIYVGPTASGATIGVITLNVDVAEAVALLRTAELSDGEVLFSGERVPVGWVATGTVRSVRQFLAGATGSSTPDGGTRSLYADPADAIPSWENRVGGTSVVLSTWPVQVHDPLSEARYSMDGEIDVEVRRADGTTTKGFASGQDSEFFEFVVWQDGASWLALSRPRAGALKELIDLAAKVQPASLSERVRFDALATD